MSEKDLVNKINKH